MAETQVSLRNGRTIVVRPIQSDELDRIVLRCWPDRATLERLFADHGTIGMAAWDGEKNVAQLHCYRLVSPGGSADLWPQWSRPDYVEDIVNGSLGITGAVWCHACFHVGRTLETFCAEILEKEVLPAAREHQWDEERIVREASASQTNFTSELVRRVLQAKRSEAGFTSWEQESYYFGKGLGTALCKESVRWASSHGYAAVLAPGAADGLLEFARWSGHLPWTTYAKLGFRACALSPGKTEELPGWIRGQIHEPIAIEVKNALQTRPANELMERVMVLDLRNAQPRVAGDP